MNSYSLSEKSKINARVFRYQSAKVESTKKVAVHVQFWTNNTGDSLDFISIKNKKHCVKLELKVKRNLKGSKLNDFFVPISFCQVFDSKNKDEKIDFEFESEGRDLFVISIDTGDKPTGGKRSVVTYEDTDLIDDTLL